MECIYLNPIYRAGINDNFIITDRIENVGFNTGNLVFVNAIKQQIKFKKEYLPGDITLTELAQDNVGALSCANFINLDTTYLVNLWKIISRQKFPVTLVGLGAQSTPKLNTPKKLMSFIPQEGINALHNICDRVVSIGVRGEFTAACLELIGIKNYRVIGCPSLYLNEKQIKNIKQPKGEKCVFNIITGNQNERKVLELGIDYNMNWIMQCMIEMPKTVYEDRTLTQELVQRRFPGYGGDVAILEEFMRSNAKMFFDMQDWYSYMEEEGFTFSFGARFHGNVVAYRSGIPALWIVHDSRTKELTDLFQLPAIDFSTLGKIKHLEELLEYCSYDEYYKRYPYMLNEYIKFLDENHIDHIWN